MDRSGLLALIPAARKPWRALALSLLGCAARTVLGPLVLAASCGTGRAAAAPEAGVQAAETIVVTGTFIPGAIRPSDPNVTVISREDIQARHPRDVNDLLGSIPGIYVQQEGGRSGVASVFTRGAKPNFTVVLINGVKVNDPTGSRGGSFDFSRLSLLDIDRIEIVRGPASAIYGSDAVGGVINIITAARAPATGVIASAEFGGQGFYRASVNETGFAGPVQVRLSVAREDEGTALTGDRFAETTVALSLAATPWQDASATGFARYAASQGLSFPDSSGGPLLAVFRSLQNQSAGNIILGADLTQSFSPLWSQRLHYGLYAIDSSTTSPGVHGSIYNPSGVPASLDNVAFQRYDVLLVESLTPWSNLALAFGVEGQFEAGSDDGWLRFGDLVVPQHYALRRPLGSLFSQAAYTPFPELHVSLSGRLDTARAYAPRFSPRIAASYDFARARCKLDAEWSEGYKLPSFYALGNALVGNPALKSEIAQNYEVGLTHTLVMLPASIKLTAYRTMFSNLIDFDPTLFRLVNFSSVTSRGFEASLTLTVVDGLDLKPFASYDISVDNQTGMGLRDVPAWLAGGEATWRPGGGWMLDAASRFVSPLTDNAVPTGDVRLGSHMVVDLNGTWNAMRGVEVFAAVTNLFDAHYQEVVGFPALGIAVRSGIRLAL